MFYMDIYYSKLTTYHRYGFKPYMNILFIIYYWVSIDRHIKVPIRKTYLTQGSTVYTVDGLSECYADP